MSQFSYDQGATILYGDHSTSSAFVTEATFTAYGEIQIFVGREKLYCPRLDGVGVRSPRGVLFWHECLDLVNEFVKDVWCERCQLWSISSRRTIHVPKELPMASNSGLHNR